MHRKDDIGKQVLYRDFYMSGWGLKVIIIIILFLLLSRLLLSM